MNETECPLKKGIAGAGLTAEACISGCLQVYGIVWGVCLPVLQVWVTCSIINRRKSAEVNVGLEESACASDVLIRISGKQICASVKILVNIQCVNSAEKSTYSV